jgi:hypothetical protein
MDKEPILIESSPEPDSDLEAPPAAVVPLRRSTRLAKTQPRVDASGRIQKLTVAPKLSRNIPTPAALQNGLIRKCERQESVSTSSAAFVVIFLTCWDVQNANSPLTEFGKRGPLNRNGPRRIRRPNPSIPQPPFKLQLSIHSTLQKILESALWHFAKHWIPDLLLKNRWDIPEAAELNLWWDSFAGCQLPQHALDLNTQFQMVHLEALFNRIKHIRHTAVHRRY